MEKEEVFTRILVFFPFLLKKKKKKFIRLGNWELKTLVMKVFIVGLFIFTVFYFRIPPFLNYFIRLILSITHIFQLLRQTVSSK